MARADKAAAVAEITDAFRDSAAAVLTEYRGLTVSEITELRRALGANVSYSVVKNTLTRIAARDAGLADLESLLTGPTAIAFVKGDPVEAAKGLRDFARAHPSLVVKGGVLDGRPISVKEVSTLAALESREVLLAKLAGAMQGALQQAVNLLNAPLSQLARLTGALRDKATADPSVLRGGAGTPEPEAHAAPEPVADAPSEAPDDPSEAPAAASAPAATEATIDATEAPAPDAV
ncbi:MAG: 50S ribosomal protein L10 [Mycobacteriales bacterium]